MRRLVVIATTVFLVAAAAGGAVISVVPRLRARISAVTVATDEPAPARDR